MSIFLGWKNKWEKFPEDYDFIIIALFLIVSILLKYYPSTLVDYYYSVLYKGPVKWQDIDIHFPKGTIYIVSEDSVNFRRYFYSSSVGYGSLYIDYGYEAPVEENWVSVNVGSLYIDYKHEGTKDKMIKSFKNLELYFNKSDQSIISSNINDKFFEITASEPSNLIYDFVSDYKCYPKLCIQYYGKYEGKKHFVSIIEDVEKKIIDK